MSGVTEPVRATGTEAAIALTAVTADERRTALASRHEDHRVAVRVDRGED